MARVKIPVSFSYTTNPAGSTPTYVATTSGGSATKSVDLTQPVQNTTVTVTSRGTGLTATVYQTETGGATYTTLTTDASGNVPGWVNEGSYQIVAAAQGAFGGATYYFDATRGDGVSNIAAGAVTSTALATTVSQALVPPGTILDHTGVVAPSGYVLADGSVYAIGSAGSTYYALSQACGTRWNTGGEGTGNFRVPDLRGLVTVGGGTGSSLTSRSVGPRLTGVLGGEESHLLTDAESGTNGNAITQPQYNGIVQYTGSPSSVEAWIGTASLTYGVNFQSGYLYLNARYADIAHNNMPPFAVCSKIVKL